MIHVANDKGWLDNINMSDLSRTVRKLEEYGYVKHTQTERGKIVTSNISWHMFSTIVE